MNETGTWHQEIAEQTKRWLLTYVIGLRLCPFAEPVVKSGRLAIHVTQAKEPMALLQRLEEELIALANTAPSECETTLLVHPCVLQDFAEYNDFLDLAEGLLEQLGFSGMFQLASFHPDYCFAGEPVDDPANLTNRSPYPMLHLLREASISSVLDAGADTDAIVNRNMQLLRGMSVQMLEQLHRSAQSDAADD